MASVITDTKNDEVKALISFLQDSRSTGQLHSRLKKVSMNDLKKLCRYLALGVDDLYDYFGENLPGYEEPEYEESKI